uniref:Putative secreted protein n=1 Tax=Anopheles darlingi TaxID=43151 RepID=A0A2M4DKB2_ANODA
MQLVRLFSSLFVLRPDVPATTWPLCWFLSINKGKGAFFCTTLHRQRDLLVAVFCNRLHRVSHERQTA